MKNKTSVFSLLFALSLTTMLSVSAQAQAFNPMSITGRVTEYKPADCAQNGTITIAGVKLTIAAGVYTTFVDNGPIVTPFPLIVTGAGIPGGVRLVPGGIILTQGLRSENWQVLSSNRSVGVYLDTMGRVRWLSSTSFPTSAASALSVTGIINDVTPNSITINNVKFSTATPVAATANPTQVVRVSGSFNANNELTSVTVSTSPYRNVRLCGAPRTSRGEGLTTFLEAYVQSGDYSGLIGTGNFVCDLSPGNLTIDGAGATIAPNASFPDVDTSVAVSACYDLVINQFGHIVDGIKIGAASGAQVCGTLEAYAPAYTGAVPTALTESGQRGSIRIGGLTMTIAPNQKLTGIDAFLNANGSVMTPNPSVCLTPVFDPAGPSGGLSTVTLDGERGVIRAFQLLNGSSISKQ